ncbi:MAG: PAS domain S-box protein [Rhodomicrobium sp.]
MLEQLWRVAHRREPGKGLNLSSHNLAHLIRVSSPLALLLAMASVSVLALLLLFWFSVSNDYEATLERGWQAAERASALTEDYTARAFEISRQLTQRAAGRIESRGIGYFRGENFAELAELAGAAPMIGSIWIFDDQGSVVANSIEPEPAKDNFSDREFYPVLRGGAAADIMGLIHGRVVKRWFFSYNLAIRPAGKFTGVVQAKLYSDTFAKFFTNLGLGPGAQLGIYRHDGTLVMSWSGMDASANAGPAQLLAHLAQGNQGRFEDDTGGARYLRAYRVLPAFDLAVSTSINRDAVLQPFWRRLGRNSALLGLAYSLIAGFAAAAYRAVRREEIEANVRDIAEHRLRASEARYRLLVEQSADGIFVADAQGRYIDVNPAGCAMFGSRRDEILSRTIGDFVVADEIPRFEPEAAKLAGGKVMLSEWRFRRKDGSVFIGETLARQLPDGRLQGIVRDITDRKRAEERLRESEERFRGIYEYAATGIAITNLEGQFQSCNPAFSAMLGHTEDELHKLFFPDLIYVDDREENMVLIARLHAGQIPSIELVNRYVRKDGRLVWVHKRVSLLKDAAGTPTHHIALVTDITEHRRAQEALRESEERFRGIFENAGTGIAILDMEGGFLSCNPAYSAIVGYTPEELRELNFRDLIYSEDRETNLLKVRRLIQQEIPSYQLLERYLRKDGKPVWVQKYVSLLRDAYGTPTNAIVLVTDMTERKRYEEHIDLLLHEVNHRSKNMLALVQAVARQTLAANPDEFIARFGERIQALAASQDLLVKNDWIGADLEELVRSQLAHFKDLIGARIGIKGPPLLLSASAAQTLGMALHELATNAGKYGALATAEGRVDIEWSLSSTAAGEQNFAIEWRETGGPPVSEPHRRGFGSTVLCRMAERSLDANADLKFAPAGLQWRLECAAAEVAEKSAFRHAQITNLTS